MINDNMRSKLRQLARRLEEIDGMLADPACASAHTIARKSVMIRFVFSTSLCCVFGVFGNKIPQNARKCNHPQRPARRNLQAPLCP